MLLLLLLVTLFAPTPPLPLDDVIAAPRAFAETPFVGLMAADDEADDWLPDDEVEFDECKRECVLRLLVELKRLLQTSHWCGFSPVCTKWCF